MNYFDHFNYSLANEDSQVEGDLLKGFQSAASICGAGGRAFSLISSELQTLKVIDLSEAQLLYARLQWECLLQLERADYLRLFGFEDAGLEERRKTLSRLSFSSDVQSFASVIPEEKLAKGLIYGGRWESYLMTISRLIRLILQYDFRPLFEHESLQAQGKLYRENFPHRRLHLLMNIFANPRLMNILLYKGRMAGKDDLIPFLKENFEKFFTQSLAREGLFHQLLFLGKLKYPQAYPPYLRPENYERIKNFSGRIQFIKTDLTTALQTESAQFWSCSDVLSYFSEQDQKKLQQTIDQRTENGRLVFRTFLKHPELSFQRWRTREDLNASAASQDSTYLYKFQIFDSV